MDIFWYNKNEQNFHKTRGKNLMIQNALLDDISKKSEYIYVPVSLFYHPKFQELSGEALLLYSILLFDQETNKCTDEEGKKFTHVILDDVCKIFRCKRDRARRIVYELDEQHGMGLIATRKLSNGHTVTYVQNSF